MDSNINIDQSGGTLQYPSNLSNFTSQFKLPFDEHQRRVVEEVLKEVYEAISVGAEAFLAAEYGK